MNNKKRIYIIGTVGVPACYGGFESLVDNLLDYTPADVEYTVFCSAKKYGTRLERYKGARLIYLDRDANGTDSIFYDYESMKIAVRQQADIMLILGVSGCVFLPKIRHAFKGKIITNIDGLEWKRDKWCGIAKWVLHYCEKQAIKYSDIIIGDNKGITDYVRAEYAKIITKKQIELIAYGGDQVFRVKDDLLFDAYPFCRENYAVTVCRIEPENNVHLMLEAFSQMPEKQLVVIGNWEKSKYGRNLKEKYDVYPNLHILSPIYEPYKINWIRSNAIVYLHGHSAGGTNPSLVEAMNLGLPILAFDCVYNRATTGEKALFWKTADDLTRLLLSNTDSDKLNLQLREIGETMAKLGKELYSWARIANQYNALY